METTGRYDSSDGMTAFSWSLLEWPPLYHKLCSIGLHVASRRSVVVGYVGFSAVERAYCACGRKCWIKYEGRWEKSETTEPGAHLRWIERFVENRQTEDRHRTWERAMSEAHPCWGEHCISCGCSVNRPCVSHQGRPRPAFNMAAMHAAYERQNQLGHEIWPNDA